MRYLARLLGIAAALTGAMSVAAPPRATDPFVISTDSSLYGKRVSQQIPSIARVQNRWFCIWYGVNKGERGVSGEGGGAYNTLAISDDGCRTWKEVAYFIPNPKADSQSVIDPRLTATPDGRLLILLPVTGQKGRTRSLWSTLLKNPLAATEPFDFGPPTFVDFGFVGSPALIDGKIHFTADQTAGLPPYDGHAGMKLHRVISMDNGAIRTEPVSRLPFAAADGSLNSFFEVSMAQTGPDTILAFFRTPTGQYTTRSNDKGKTWSAPIPFTAHPNAKNTKADLARSPSGRLVLAFNRQPGARTHMCVALSSDGGKTWPDYYVFDERTNPGSSYPNIAFGADAKGDYDGMIFVAYDHGRGRKPPNYEKEITIARISEAGVIEKKPAVTRFVVSK